MPGARRPPAQIVLGLGLLVPWFVFDAWLYFILDRPEDNPWFLVPSLIVPFVILFVPFWLIPYEPLPYSPDTIPQEQLP